MNELIKKSKRDISLVSSLDMNSILSNINNTTTTTRKYLIGKTTISISQEIGEVINSIQYYTEEQKQKLLGVLKNEYMFIDELCDLQNSSYLMLIPRDPTKKKTGGILVSVKILSTGTDILILSGRRILQYKFDLYYIFQKLKDDDLLFLYLHNEC